MSAQIYVKVRYSTQAYVARFPGATASSTMSAQAAVERLAEKVFGPGAHKLLAHGDDTIHGCGTWEVTPAGGAVQAPSHVISQMADELGVPPQADLLDGAKGE